ncbi:MBL fold metallo-hydrolase [Rhizobium sp. Pop5]|uniref:MBL fold metallo-hydrolase n=1 Tax=Rhizobium sp. Pop5 TaxID=1223565 RepID=UPI00028372FF|nr:MBL fold metallo-hydrolase [Rhizobium sp. Pop5]EJZ22166.1 hypothetical protein RCCGEPOP_06231 [Rhizobium sp. Pop5]UVD56996.1 MBL fold metallo-hydrolase [Rhizobium sp. Pop5]
MRQRIHERVQHPVGQGFFHSGLVHGEGGTVRYVVDCGSMKKYETARKSRIRAYIRDVKKHSRKSRLDILFITHLHVDHVSGIEQLLDARSGLQVDTIVMPLLDDIDRLIAFARSYAEDRASADTEFYRTFVTQPSSAFSRFNPRQVIFFRAGDGDGGTPGGADSPLAPIDYDLPGGLKTERSWTFARRGDIPTSSAENLETVNDAGLVVLPDTVAAAVNYEHGHWLLAPFVDPGISQDRPKFLKALAEERGLSVPKMKSWLRERGNLEDLLTTGTADLIAAYHSLTRDLNVTSLCLYSGPAHPFPAHEIWTGRDEDHSADWGWGFGKSAWMGTGDAALASQVRRKAFLKHYGPLLSNVGTFTLPHHGSVQNFHPELVRRIKPRLCVAAADRYSNWSHPGAHVVQSVCSLGSAVHVATSEMPSRLFECVDRWKV